MMHRFMALPVALLLVAACGERTATSGDDALPRLGADAGTSVSGVSSGGYMAGQYQVAFSADVDGAAIVAAGPWGCAGGSIQRALAECVSGEGIDVAALHSIAGEMAGAGTIDALENLREDRLFLFHGQNDAVVAAGVVDATRRWSEDLVSADNVSMVDDVPAAHGWVTDGYGNGCDEFGSPYINDCGFDLAGRILAHLLGELNRPAEHAGALQAFSQSEFGDAGLAESGYLYVPSSCRGQGGCQVHVHFHGCQQSAVTIGNELAANSGFNRWAETNSIVVLYPQVEPSSVLPMNPYGCWDWWGYTGADYLGRHAPQLAALRAMVERLASPRD